MSMSQNEALEHAINTVLSRIPEDKLLEFSYRMIMRSVAKNILSGRVMGAVTLEADALLQVAPMDEKTLSLKISNLQEENVPLDSILLIVTDHVSGETALFVVGDPTQSLVVFQDSSKQDTTDQTNP